MYQEEAAHHVSQETGEGCIYYICACTNMCINIYIYIYKIYIYNTCMYTCLCACIMKLSVCTQE